MPAILAAPAWPVLLLLAVQLGSAAGAPQLWQCAPCSPERLASCPAVPPSCQEVTRSARCGCCPMCALRQGSSCGMSTARCASGLVCRAPLGDARPLQALAQGRGTCVAEANYSGSNVEAAGGSVSIQGPCQQELHRVMEKLAKEQERADGGPYKFYLPNCTSNGFYHRKQCETTLDGGVGLCWCVYPQSGVRVPGSPEVRGDPNCE